MLIFVTDYVAKPGFWSGILKGAQHQLGKDGQNAGIPGFIWDIFLPIRIEKIQSIHG